MLFKKCIFPLFLLLNVSPLDAQESRSASFKPTDQPFVHQAQQRKYREAILKPDCPDVHLSASVPNWMQMVFPQEKECFDIQRVQLTGHTQFPRWLALQQIADQAQGHCLGNEGLDVLMVTLQNRLVDWGYIMSRVLAPSQDLNEGTLQLLVEPSQVRQLCLTADSDRYIQLDTAFPARAHHSLNLRDLEQGLENLQRLSTVQASVEMVLSAQPGESDIVVNWQQKKKWQLAVFLDDAVVHHRQDVIRVG